MEELENITFTNTNIICLGITVLLLVLIPVAFWFFWQRSHKGQLKYKYLIAGIVGFIISARVLELGVHYFCILSDNPVSQFINGNTLAFVIYGITMAGVFEECGRYIILKYIVKKDRTPENAVLYGIGHGGIEVLAVILPSIVSELVIAALFSAGDISSALSTLKITEETAAAALPSITAASQFGAASLAFTSIERVLAMCIHIGLTVIVFYGIFMNRKGILALAIVLHMATDIFPALYQRAVVPLWLCENWCALWTAVIVVIAVKLYKKMKAQAVSG